jgi:hypothetical protein
VYGGLQSWFYGDATNCLDAASDIKMPAAIAMAGVVH